MIGHMKTLILWFLILLSVFLTYQIWTFQPEYAILKTEYIDYKQIGEAKNIQEVIKPRQIVLHFNGNKYSPYDCLTYYETFFEKYSGLTFEKLSFRNSNEFEEGRKLQFIFPASIPIESFKDVFQFGSNEHFFIEEIDEIIFIQTGIEDNEQINVEFISYDEEKTVLGETNFPVNKFVEEFKVEESEFQFYDVFPHELVGYRDVVNKVVYLPVDHQQVSSVTYLAKPINTEHFKQALFSDPNFVKHYMQSNGEESFTDGNRMVNIISNGNILRYINPTVGEVVDRGSKHFLFSAVEFLNGHGGLTNSFYYDRKKTLGTNEEITFRLTINGIPVYKSNFYSINHLFEITLSRVGGNQIEQYVRPLFLVEKDPINISSSVMLASGSAVLKAIENKEDFNRYLLTDIQRGYTMVKRQSFVIFEPSWFIYYNGSWEEVKVVEDVVDSEAISDGLE